MEFVLSVFSFIFIGLIVIAAFTIGFSLLIWFTLLGVVITVYLVGRQYWMRWQFLRQNRDEPASGRTQVIEGVFTEITDNTKP